MNHYPFDITLDCRRAHARRRIHRQLAWLCVFNAMALLSVGLGILIAATHSALLSILAGLAILAGIQGANYLFTRH